MTMLQLTICAQSVIITIVIDECEQYQIRYSFTRRLRWFSQCFTSYFILDYFFLPAIATALPLRVRALFLVFCPRTGSPRR